MNQQRPLSMKPENVYPSLDWHKERSIIRSISDAWKIFAIHIKDEIGVLFPVAITASMATAFFIEMFRMYAMDHIVPAYHLSQMSDNGLFAYALVPDTLQAILMLLGMLLAIALSYYVKGRIIGMLSNYAQCSHFSCKAFPTAMLTATDRRFSRRIFSIDIFLLLLLIVATAIVATLAWKVNIWFAWALILIALWLVPATLAAETYHSLHAFSYRKSLQQALWKRWGGCFTICLITFIPMAIALLIGLLPIYAYTESSYAIAETWLMGDQAIYPSTLPVLFFLLNTFGILFCIFASLLPLYALALYTNPEKEA